MSPNESGPGESPASGRMPSGVSDGLASLGQVARADAVFGEPRTVGEVTVIPCAEVMCGLGFGFGSGQSPEVGQGGAAQGSGGGGGGGARSRPLAIIAVSRGEVKITPVVDVSQIALAAIAAWGFIATAAIRSQRRMKQADRAEQRGMMPRRFRRMLQK